MDANATFGAPTTVEILACSRSSDLVTARREVDITFRPSLNIQPHRILKKYLERRPITEGLVSHWKGEAITKLNPAVTPLGVARR